MTKRRRTSRPKRTETVRIDSKEVKRLAKFARSFMPRGADMSRGRSMSDRRVIVKAFVRLGAETGTVYKSPGNEVTVRSLSLLLANIDDREVLLRSIWGGTAVEKRDREKRSKLRAQLLNDFSIG